MITNLIVKFDLEGGHQWPDAPRKYEHLKSFHHHIFHFECYIPVKQLNRELEFLDVRRILMKALESSYGPEPCDFRSLSCEQLAQSLSRTVVNKFSVFPYRVIVMEDPFVGAEVVFDSMEEKLG